jgi:hypothetical protein
MTHSPVRLALLLLATTILLAAPSLARPEKILDTPTGWT